MSNAPASMLQNIFQNISSEQLEETQAYMDQHKLPFLFQHLMAALLFHRPGKRDQKSLDINETLIIISYTI